MTDALFNVVAASTAKRFVSFIVLISKLPVHGAFQHRFRKRVKQPDPMRRADDMKFFYPQ